VAFHLANDARVSASVSPSVVLAGLPPPLTLLSPISQGVTLRLRVECLYSTLPRRIVPTRRRPGTTRATTMLVDSRKSRNRRQWKRIAGNYRPGNRNAVAADAPRHHLLTLSAPQTRATTLSLSEFTSVEDFPICSIVTHYFIWTQLVSNGSIKCRFA